MKVMTPGVYCIVLDTSAAGFLDVNELIGVTQDADQTDAGGGS